MLICFSSDVIMTFVKILEEFVLFCLPHVHDLYINLILPTIVQFHHVMSLSGVKPTHKKLCYPLYGDW